MLHRSSRLQEVCSFSWMGEATLQNNRLGLGINEKEPPGRQLQDSHCSPCSNQLVKETEDKCLNIRAIHAEDTTGSGTIAILAERGHASNNIAIAKEVRAA